MENHQKYLEIFDEWQVIYKEELALADKGVTHHMWIAAGAK